MTTGPLSLPSDRKVKKKMTKVPLNPFYDSSGTVYRLGKRIGSGGEGDVYELLPSRDLVAKIYKKPIEQHKQEKLLLMAHGCNEELKEISAWPTDVLRARTGGPVVGFLMPRITGCEPVHKVYGPTHRKEVFPHADWRFLVRSAKNLAAAFSVIHKFGYVIGDVNEGNILVDDKACVRLIDCDSFQLRTKNQIFRCEVGVAQFTPPEILQSKNFQMERTANHDDFGLAVLIFLLLFFGRHPYSGVYSGKEDMPIEKAIAEFRFAYGKSATAKSVSPPPNSASLSVLPGFVADLFEQAFSELGTRRDGRPEAGEWWEALGSLEQKMKQCSADPVHTYYAGLSACPWCRLEEASGVLLFLSRDSITKIDLRREWEKVDAIRPPGPAPMISPGNFAVRPEPLSSVLERSLEFTVIRQVAGFVLSAAIILLVLSGMVADLPTLLAGMAIVGILLLFPGKSSEEKKRRKQNLSNARYLYDLWNRKWNSEAGDGAYQAQIARLRELRRNFETIERGYRSGILTLEKTAKERQFAQFLNRTAIETCPIFRTAPHIGSALKTAGIKSAADLTRKRLQGIPQLDNTRINELLIWRERTEKNFLFDPSKGLDRSDLLPLIQKYQPLMKPVEREMKAGVANLRNVDENIRRKRSVLRPSVEKRAKELAQAEADFSLVCRTPDELILRDLDNLIHPRSPIR